jgi:hypothetical protein
METLRSFRGWIQLQMEKQQKTTMTARLLKPAGWVSLELCSGLVLRMHEEHIVMRIAYPCSKLVTYRFSPTAKVDRDFMQHVCQLHEAAKKVHYAADVKLTDASKRYDF